MSNFTDDNAIHIQFDLLEELKKQALQKYVPVEQKIQVLVEAYYLGFIPDYLYKSQFADLMIEEQKLKTTALEDSMSPDNEEEFIKKMDEFCNQL